jgi:hypothetical protein
MWIDQHPYLFIYLLGSALVLILSIFNTTLFWLIAWLTKGNVLARNLKKLDPPDEQSLGQKVLVFVVALAFEAALSWIGVVVAVWQTLVTLLKTVRETLVSTPEAIKLLRFPLRNNPDMSREAVWAYVHALRVRVGEKLPDEDELLYSLNNLREEHPSFDREAALNQLKGLNIVSADVISSALSHMSLAEEET